MKIFFSLNWLKYVFVNEMKKMMEEEGDEKSLKPQSVLIHANFPSLLFLPLTSSFPILPLLLCYYVNCYYFCEWDKKFKIIIFLSIFPSSTSTSSYYYCSRSHIANFHIVWSQVGWIKWCVWQITTKNNENWSNNMRAKREYEWMSYLHDEIKRSGT